MRLELQFSSLTLSVHSLHSSGISPSYFLQLHHSLQLHPAEQLWQLSDESLVNGKFESLDTLEETLATHCVVLSVMLEAIRQQTLFHGWKEA